MRWKNLVIGIMLSFLFITNTVLCDDLKIVDKENYQEIEGLVPDPVLEWFKCGDFMMRVGGLNYDHVRTLPVWVLKTLSKNIGKYDLNEDCVIVDAKTGSLPALIEGIPFPEIDADDKMAAAKIMFNSTNLRQITGPHRDRFRFGFYDGKNRKLERTIKTEFYTDTFVGWDPAKIPRNPDKLEFQTQVLIKEPYDMAGTSLMTWRYLDNRPDMLFGYFPAIRRVRRMTPASRSDSLFGTDFARDDASYSGYDGKIGDVEWRIIGEGEILACFASADPLSLEVNKDGEWFIDLTDRKKYAAYGYEDYAKDYYKGDVAPWCQTSNVWVKRPVWIIEGRPKDPYYNYGRQIHWMDKETFQDHWKQIFDRSDEYWKMLWYTWTNAKSKGGKEAAVLFTGITMIDERNYHGTGIEVFCKDCYYIVNAKTNDVNQFSISGFTKISK